MLYLLFFGLALPLAALWFFKTFFEKVAVREAPPELRELLKRRPIERKTFRLVRLSQDAEPQALGDFAAQPEAVDAAYRAKEQADAAGERARFLVLDERGIAIEEVDAGPA